MKIILLGLPHVSDFLKNTIIEHGIRPVKTAAAIKVMKGLSPNFISEEEAIKQLSQYPETRLYTNSENALGWLYSNLPEALITKRVESFKNKIKCREMLQALFPDYYFRGVKRKELKNLDVSTLKFPFIIKPAVGFFSIAVYKVENAEEWIEVIGKIDAEIERNIGQYEISCMDASEMIIEALIEGDEYAIDCYYDENGKANVLNILQHKFASAEDVSDRVYFSNAELIKELGEPFEQFMQQIGDLMGIQNFPLHIEVRKDEKGLIIPIEINPLRFGGYCTTADHAWFAYRSNSIGHYFDNSKPDWTSLLKGKNGKTYSLVLLDNCLQISSEKIKAFNYKKVKEDFEHILEMRKVDYHKFPIFGFLFTETSKENQAELDHILSSDLSEYIVLK